MVLAETAVFIRMWLFQHPDFVALALLHADDIFYRSGSDPNRQVGVRVAISRRAV